VVDRLLRVASALNRPVRGPPAQAAPAADVFRGARSSAGGRVERERFRPYRDLDETAGGRNNDGKP
jgi:hypothetical protein